MNLLVQLPSFYSVCARPLCVLSAALSLCLVSHQDCQHLRAPSGSYLSETQFLAGYSASASVCLLASFIHPSSFIQQVFIHDYFVPELVFSDEDTFMELIF